MRHDTVKKMLSVQSNRAALGLFGRRDEHLRLVESACDVRIVARGTEIWLEGSPESVDTAADVLTDLLDVLESRPYITTQDVRACIDVHQRWAADNGLSESGAVNEENTPVGGPPVSMGAINGDLIQVTARGKRITPRSFGQKQYVDAMRLHDIVFCVGPAGTGKTYLAMAMAVKAFKEKQVNRIILTRPAVEAGESLGFLPGDLQEKVDPYLRPLYDALYDILGADSFQRHMERHVIEVAPLAYMRGRTLDDAFIILDEAQNTTPEQMKMFLTRMGFGSKLVVTGDVTQIDLPEGKQSGLKEARDVLKDVEGIAFVQLSDQDVVRHELVRRIIIAYESRDRTTEKNDGA